MYSAKQENACSAQAGGFDQFDLPYLPTLPFGVPRCGIWHQA
jgi:hypothetical protein